MNEEKPKIYKRICAYLIDLIVVVLLSGILTNIFVNTDKYYSVIKEQDDLLNEYKNKEISNEEYLARYRENNYEVVNSSINITIITISVSVAYYVIMLYFCHGITLGKYLMKIRIISANDKKLNIFNYLLRSLILNNLLSNVAGIIMFYTLSKNDYINISEKVNSLFSLILIVSYILVMYRNDGRGLHDLIANTKVVNIDYDSNDESEEKDIQDAKVISEKKARKTKKKEGK